MMLMLLQRALAAVVPAQLHAVVSTQCMMKASYAQCFGDFCCGYLALESSLHPIALPCVHDCQQVCERCTELTCCIAAAAAAAACCCNHLPMISARMPHSSNVNGEGAVTFQSLWHGVHEDI
jgi:hypothetical protein